MFRYLVLTSYDVFRDEGIGGVVREVLKYTSLYGSPRKLAAYWLTKTINPNALVVTDVQGSKMALNLSAGGIHGDLYMYRKREPQATDVMQEILHSGMTVLEIGANVGYYALMEAQRCRKVYAVEPGRDNFENLKRNIALNPYRNIETFETAIGDHEGTASFLLNKKAPNWHRVALEGEPGETVPMTTLDAFWKKLGSPQIDLLRMDVEGYELNILKGGRELLAVCRPKMFLEVHRDHIKKFGGTALGLLEFLAGFDYSITHAFVIGKSAPTGRLKELLANPRAAKVLTEKGMASHLFFGRES